uniref:ATP synthase F(0) complex subunit e, mitochondrial n=1 Tax=Parascaris equorum TaxID=6256 RepID=A0A914S2L4_PAREQ
MRFKLPQRQNLVSPSILPRLSSFVRICASRFSGLGIMWGAYRLRKIREYHADIREWEHEKQVAKAAEAARNKKWLAKDEMRYLMKVGSVFPLVFTRFSCVVKFVNCGQPANF